MSLPANPDAFLLPGRGLAPRSVMAHPPSEDTTTASSHDSLPTGAQRRPGWILGLLPITALLLAGLVTWKGLQKYDPPAAPERAFIRPAPVFQLHDSAMKLMRLQRYVGRSKFLVAFVDASQGADQSPVLQGLRDHWSEFERAGGVVLAVTATRPAENRQAIERLGSLPFPLLSDLNQLEVHRQYGACNEQGNQPREAVVIVDRAGLIRFVHYAPETLGTSDQWARELAQVR
jgi:peroxiredoxin